MEVKKIVEGMTAVEVAEVIDSNFKNQNKILEEDIATQNSVIGVSEYKDFSEAEAVSVGDVRKYNGFLYECVEATTGAFDASKWKKSSFKAETEKKLSELGSEVQNNKANSSEIYRSESAAAYNDIESAVYYSGYGVYTPETYNAYAVAYYNVSEGDKFLVKGREFGNNVAAIALLTEKGSQAVKVFDISPSNSSSIKVNRVIEIPSGINYMALSVGYNEVYRLKAYNITEQSRIDKALSEINSVSEDLEGLEQSSQVAIKGLRTISDFIMPSTGQRNLIADDTLYLKEAEAIKGVFEFSSATYKHEFSRFIKVKPSTIYTMGRVHAFYEWDSNFNQVKFTVVNSTGYSIHSFTTSENTSYITIKKWIDNKGKDEQTKFLVEGNTTDVLEPVVLEMDTYKGAKAGFTPGTKTLSIIGGLEGELYRDITPIAETHITKDYYISESLEKVQLEGWKICYIPVESGKDYIVRGKSGGNSVAVVSLVEDIDVLNGNSKALYVSKEITGKNINILAHIPQNINYIALSVGVIGVVSVYRKTETSRLDVNEQEIKNVEKKFDRVVDVERLQVEERVDNHYYSGYGAYNEDSYKVFHLEYYAVEEGQNIHLKGKYNGNISAFVLVQEKGERASLLYGYGTSGASYTIDEVITVPKGYKWLARSFSVATTTEAYITETRDRFEHIEEEIEEIQKNLGVISSKWAGKRLLAIGDSITAQNLWQKKVGELLGMNVRTHAKGGIGIIQMVDGDGSGDAPEGYDPDAFGTSTIYKLNEEDVEGVDILILMGFYNTRSTAKSNRGELTDMYPEQNTWYGQMNYAIKRVYEELEKAGNYNCKVVICSAHNYGKYPYVNESAYDDGQILLEATKAIANRHSLFLIDLMNNGNINMYNWGKFQASSTSYAENYIPSDGVNDGTNKPFASLDAAPSASANTNKYITVSGVSGCYKSDGSTWVKLTSPNYPWNGDQLHLGKEGGYRLGEYIAGQLTTI